MKVNKTILMLFLIGAAAQAASAQWVGADGPPVEPSHKNVAFLGEDTNTTTVPSVPSTHVEVYGEGWDTPPVYAATQERIAALKLNEKQEAVLKAEFPDFVPWTLADYGNSVKYYPFSKRQQPYAISWDYDGRGNFATVITGHIADKRIYGNNYIVVLRPYKDSYKVVKWNTETGLTGIPALRLVKNGAIARVDQNCDAPLAKELWHTGFADMDITISTKSPPNEWLQSDVTNAVVYYHEGVFGVGNAQIVGLKPSSPVVFHEKFLKDVAPSADMINALREYDKDFTIWDDADYPREAVSSYRYSGNSMPYAIKHDLSGDGVDDMVVAGHNNDSNVLLELISGTSGYHVRSIGESEPCYGWARKRGETLTLRPSHVLSLHKKGMDFISLSSEAVKDFWHYNDSVLVGMRALYTCKEPAKLRTTAEAEMDWDKGFFNCSQYGGWQLRSDVRTDMYVYGEKEDSEGYGCLGSDSCKLEVLPPGSGLR